jgi:hypothetical protein
MRTIPKVLLVSNPAEPLGLARTKVIRAMLGAALQVWPAQGMTYLEPMAPIMPTQVWIAPEAANVQVFQFSRYTQDYGFSFGSIAGWVWFMSRQFPGATIHFLQRRDISPSLKQRPLNAEATGFRLQHLKQFFHNLGNWAGSGRKAEVLCATAWIKRLDEPRLAPLAFFGTRENWDRWNGAGEGSQFRRQIAEHFGEACGRAVVQSQALGVIAKVADEYHGMACGNAAGHPRSALAPVHGTIGS